MTKMKMVVSGSLERDNTERESTDIQIHTVESWAAYNGDSIQTRRWRTGGRSELDATTIGRRGCQN